MTASTNLSWQATYFKKFLYVLLFGQGDSL
jgi:hypothetical protein